MLRIAASICIVVLLSGCEKNWRGLIVEKRIYRDGYYVHLPWKRSTPELAYPKPAPYPVDHSRTAATDTTQKNAGGVAQTNQQPQPAETFSNPQTPTGPSHSGSGIARSREGIAPDSLPVASGNSSPVDSSASKDNPAAVAEQTNPSAEPAMPPAPRVDSSVAASIPVKVDTADHSGFEFPEGDISLVAELGFYNPVYTTEQKIKPFSYNAGCALRYTIHPWSRHEISGESGIYANGFFLHTDSETEASRKKERILQIKSRFLVMDHIYFTRKEDAKFDAIEFGLFSDIGFFSTHVSVDSHGNDDDAMLTRNKSRLFGLHYLHRMQCGLTARIANNVWSVFANYRFNSLVKSVPDGSPNDSQRDLPKLVVGATFVLSH
jgi:hypothetical protein